MICIERVDDYCKTGEIKLIENYYQAIWDPFEIWECHHRAETDKNRSKLELRKLHLYWKRPADELIFLTKSEHRKIHHLNGSYKTRKKVLQFDRNNNFIAEFQSTQEASKFTGANWKHISDCCHFRRKSTHGFIWRFKPDET